MASNVNKRQTMVFEASKLRAPRGTTSIQSSSLRNNNNDYQICYILLVMTSFKQNFKFSVEGQIFFAKNYRISQKNLGPKVNFANKKDTRCTSLG